MFIGYFCVNYRCAQVYIALICNTPTRAFRASGASTQPLAFDVPLFWTCRAPIETHYIRKNTNAVLIIVSVYTCGCSWALITKVIGKYLAFTQYGDPKIHFSSFRLHLCRVPIPLFFFHLLLWQRCGIQNKIQIIHQRNRTQKPCWLDTPKYLHRNIVIKMFTRGVLM